MNKNTLLAVALLISAIGFGACSSTSTNTVSTGNTGSGNVADNTSVVVNRPMMNAPVETTVANKPANTATDVKPLMKTDDMLSANTAKGEKIGVPECDEYLEKYEACLKTKVPEAERGQFLPQMEMYRQGWKKAVNNQQAKVALPGGCKVALATAKQSEALSKYSCDW